MAMRVPMGISMVVVVPMSVLVGVLVVVLVRMSTDARRILSG